MDGSAGRSVAKRTDNELAAFEEPSGYDSFGLQDMYRILQRRQRVVVGICAAATLLGLAYAVFRPPVYEASAVLMMRPNEPDATATDERAKAEPDNGYVQSQVEILKSPAVLRQLVDRQHLADDPRWGMGIGEGARRAAAVRAVSNAVNVNRRDGTYIVEVSARSQDPEQAANMANDLINIYFSSREQARLEYATQTSGWLSNRLNELRGEVQAREAEVEQYRAAHGLLTVDGAVVAEAQLRDAETTALAAQADLAERQARYRQVTSMLRSGQGADTMAGALNSETMTALRTRQADVTRRLAEYSERYGDRHPTVVAARAEREDIDRQIQAEVNRLAQNLDDETAIASARVASLQGHVATVRNRLAGNNAEQVRLRELERNAQAARAVYENFLLRYHEVADGGTGLGGDAQVVASAVAPTEPVSRSALLVVLLAAALGLAAGGLAAFLIEQFTTTLQVSDDVERKAGLRILATIPELPSSALKKLDSTERHPAGFVVAKPMSAYAEAMRMLRARIAHPRLADSVKVVALTSAMAGEGKTSIALSLARATALSSRKVMLIDCDLRRRSLNHMLCIEPRAGITNVLRGEVAWKSVVGRDEASGAHVLPAAWEEFTSEELFNSDAMVKLMRELSDAYDLVILDCAPVLTLADVRHLAAQADGVVVVARSKKTQVLALQTAVHELRAVNANVLGVAFNGVDIKAPGRLSYADPLYFSHAQANLYIR